MAHRYGIAALSLGLLAVTACSNRLDVAPIEATIKADIERQGRRLSLKAVRCPTNLLRQEGAAFDCIAEIEPEGSFRIAVVQEDLEGQVRWEVPNSQSMINLVRLEESIQTELGTALGKRARVNCGSEVYRQNIPGDRFECELVGGVTVGSEQINTVLVRAEADGNLKWQEVRRPVQAGASPVGTPEASAEAPGAAEPSTSSSADSATPAEADVDGAPKTTITTGPTGRPIKKVYVPGDSD